MPFCFCVRGAESAGSHRSSATRFSSLFARLALTNPVLSSSGRMRVGFEHDKWLVQFFSRDGTPIHHEQALAGELSLLSDPSFVPDLDALPPLPGVMSDMSAVMGAALKVTGTQVCCTDTAFCVCPSCRCAVALGGRRCSRTAGWCELPLPVTPSLRSEHAREIVCGMEPSELAAVSVAHFRYALGVRAMNDALVDRPWPVLRPLALLPESDDARYHRRARARETARARLASVTGPADERAARIALSDPGIAAVYLGVPLPAPREVVGWDDDDAEAAPANPPPVVTGLSPRAPGSGFRRSNWLPPSPVCDLDGLHTPTLHQCRDMQRANGPAGLKIASLGLQTNPSRRYFFTDVDAATADDETLVLEPFCDMLRLKAKIEEACRLSNQPVPSATSEEFRLMFEELAHFEMVRPLAFPRDARSDGSFRHAVRLNLSYRRRRLVSGPRPMDVEVPHDGARNDMAPRLRSLSAPTLFSGATNAAVSETNLSRRRASKYYCSSCFRFSWPS